MISLNMNTPSDLKANGVVNVRAEKFAISGGFTDFIKFTKTWENMGTDEFYGQADKGKRFRRYSDFEYDPTAKTLTQLEHRAYEQSLKHNQYVGGIERHFSDISCDVMISPILRSLVDLDFEVYKAVLPEELHTAKWQCQIHQIRIEINPNQEIEITPEGIHCDGYPFSGVHFWGKENLSGAESRIYLKDRTVIASGTYEDVLDTTFFLDRELLHYVTPAKNNTDSPAYRQIIAISFSIPGSKYDIVK